MLIARALDPAGYGDLMFLLGSFMAIRSLLDLGSSNAFFTFLSKRARGRRFYQTYFFWLAFQFTATSVLVGLIIPSSIFDRIWLGHNREIVLLAFVAAFMQQQVWQTVVQIGEAMRKTVKVQFMNLAVALMYLTVVLLALEYGRLSVELILLILIGQYVVAAVAAYRFLEKDIESPLVDEKSTKEILRDYWQYCKPMFALALVAFTYDFANKWMLQKFGGATQQGFFQIANQFAAVSLFATTSILNVFWKEIAHAWEIHDHARVAMLYRRVSRGLVMLGACISGLLLPWSEQIVSIFLGSAYAHAWPVLAIMLLYPIHQSMGQIGGTMLLASGQTHRYMFVSVATMLVSIPVTYILLAPTMGVWLPGLEMGAMGMASQMVLLGIVSVNVQAWVIARDGGWEFDWVFQIVGIPMMIGIGVAVKYLVGKLWVLENAGMHELLAPVIVMSGAYLLIVMTVIWQFPWMVGLEHSEIKRIVKRLSRTKA
jgi:O-antigen/teichoic acid export membrane protein